MDKHCIKIFPVLKSWHSVYSSSGIIATFYVILRFIDRYFEWGNIPRSMDFKRFADDKIFNKPILAHSNWQHIRPETFVSKGKLIYFISDISYLPESLGQAIHLKSTKFIEKNKISHGAFYIYFTCDSDALPEIRNILQNGGTLIPHLDSSKTEYRFIDRVAHNSIQKTWQKFERISHMNFTVHENICEALSITNELTGDYLEIGVYKGGTILTAQNYIDENYLLNIKELRKRKTIGLDTFDGFNYEAAEASGDKMWNGTHKLFGVQETINYVYETVGQHKTELFEINICTDQIPKSVTKVSVANIDVDLYDATRDALNKVSPLVEKGGIIICEDPASTPALYGSYFAMEEFLESIEGSQYIKIFKAGSYFLLKQ